MLSNSGDVNLKAKQVTQQAADHLTAVSGKEHEAVKENPPAKPQPKLTEEQSDAAKNFVQTLKIEEPAVDDKQIAKIARRKMQERMDMLSKMFLKAETGSPDDAEAEDNHVIEEN
jgi:hypothetical protein